MIECRKKFIALTIATIATLYANHELDGFLLPKLGRISNRFCFANQCTVDGAVEFYNIENKKPIKELNEQTFRLLKDKGYLQTIPDDSGFGAGTDNHYKLTPCGVFCTHHGFRQGPYNVPPYYQLLERNITDPSLLCAASTKLHHRFVLGDDQFTYDTCKYVGLLLYWFILYFVLGKTQSMVQSRLLGDEGLPPWKINLLDAPQ